MHKKVRQGSNGWDWDKVGEYGGNTTLEVNAELPKTFGIRLGVGEENVYGLVVVRPVALVIDEGEVPLGMRHSLQEERGKVSQWGGRQRSEDKVGETEGGMLAIKRQWEGGGRSFIRRMK